MTDLNKLRSEFEELPEVKQWIERLIYGDKSEVYIPIDETEENNSIATWINGAWFVWKLKAKAQAVPEGYVLMPKVPTEKMFQAYARYSVAPMSTLSKTGYKAMVEASESGAEG
ncbi:hypothetical protein NQ804_04245 [Acinetobacter baumannii]|nr:hypothetical protein [Acinetobacter baumannii]